MTPKPYVPDSMKLRSAFASFCQTIIRPTVDVDKAVWNARIRRNDLYYRGDQHLGYGNTGVPGLVDYVSVAQSSTLNILNKSNLTLDDVYDYVLNVLQGDVDTFIAVLGSRAPNTQAQARDRSNEGEIRLKQKADRVSAWLDSSWNIDLLNGKLIRGLGLYGTMFSYTRFRIDGKKYGITHQPDFQVVNAPMGDAMYHCPYCGTVTPATQANALLAQSPGMPQNTVPCSKCGNPVGPESLVQPDTIETLVPTGTTPFANGAVECSIYNPAHFTTDLSKADFSEVPWGNLETEEDKGSLCRAFPELRNKVYSDSYVLDDVSKGSMGRWTRSLITSPTGYMVNPKKGQWLFSQLWFTPSVYEYIPGDKSGQIRDYLYETFPDGFRLPMVNGEPLVGDQNKFYKDVDGQQKPYPNRMVNERLTSVMAACKPKHGEMIYCDPYFECMIQLSDTVNDCVNVVIEQAERTNPITVADPEVFDPEYIRDNNNSPGLFYFAKPGSGGSLDKAFFRVQASQVSKELIDFIIQYIAWTREITGIVPALFGGSSGGGDQTAYEADLKHNQAMMKLTPTWTNIRFFWAKTKENGIYQAAKYSDGKLYATDQHGTVQSTELDDIWELTQGGWYMEAEESMPMSIGQRRNWVMSILKLSPEIQHTVFGVEEPDNVVSIQETVGMADWKVPGYDQIMRLHDVITKLLQSTPIPAPPGPPDPMTGMPAPPGPPTPSIPFNSFLFDPQMVVKVFKSFLWSDRGSQLEGTPGYENVMAYAQAASQAVPPPPPPDRILSINANLQDMTPPAQAEVLKHEGLQVPPGASVMLPPPPPKPIMPPNQNSGSKSNGALPQTQSAPGHLPPHPPLMPGALQ